MKSWLPRISLLIAAALVSTACQGDSSEEESAAEESPQPLPAGEMDDAELPDAPDALADLVVERMHEALSVEVRMTVTPEEEEEDEASIEDVTMSMLLTDPPAARMTTVDNSEERPSTAHTVVKDGVMYVTLEEEPLLEDKDWLRLTADEVDEAEEEIGPFAEVFRVMVKETNASLEEAAGETTMDVVRLGEFSDDPVEEDGENGEQVTRYTGTSSPRELADAGHDDFKQAADQGLEEISWELAVTEKGLPEELTVGMVTPDGEKATSTVHYSKWGAELEIDAPAKDNTGTIQESLGTA